MKHKCWKRVLALLLTVVMVSTSLPMSAFAAQVEETGKPETSQQAVLTYGGWNYTVQEDGTALICGAPVGQKVLEIPAQVDGRAVTGIAEEAFAGHETMASVIVPDTVTAVGNSAFYHCENLRAIAFMGDAPAFGFTVAEGCGALEAVFVQECYDFGYFCALLVNDLGEDGASAVEILECADAQELESSWADYLILMENGTMMLTTGASAVAAEGDFAIEDGVLTAYSGAGGDVVIPDGVTAIGESVFAENRSITGVTFPDSLTEIGTKAFFFCQNLKFVTFGSGLKTIGESAFQVTGLEGELILPEGLTNVGDYAFASCDNLSALTLPSTLTDMGFDAFGSCMCLQSVMISDGVTMIGDYAFSSCSSLSQVIIPDSVTSIGEWAFYSCQSLRSLVLPPNLKSIGGKVCGYWSAVNLVLTGNTVPEVKSDTFEAYGLETIYVPAQALSAYQAAWGSLLPNGVTIKTASVEGDFAVSNGVAVAYTGAGGDVVIPDGVTALGDDLFSGNQFIYSVTMPDSVTEIGMNVFNYCMNLKSVTLGAGLKSIDDYAFFGCESLSELTLPNGLETIGYGAFNYCTGLTGELILPDTLTSVGDEAFYGCQGLTALTVAGTNLEIGMYAFSSCTGLETLDIQDGVAVIGDGAFNYCPALTKVTIPASVTGIGAYAFGYCENLTEIYFLGDAPAMGEGAFDGVAAACYYPANNSTWTNDVIQSGGGTLTWEAFQDTVGPVMELVFPAAGSSVGGVVTFKVKVSDAICVESVTMYTSWLKVLGKYNWSEFATKTVNAASATVEFEVDISALNLKTENLYVKFSAVDSAGNQTELAAVEYGVLTTPDPPKNLGAVSTAAGIELAWTHSDTSIDMYKICRSMDGGEYEQIALIMESVKSYTDTEVVVGHVYSYQVYAGVYKIGDAFSEPATVSDVVHVDHAKPTIESIAPNNGSTLRGEVEFEVSAADNCGLLSLTVTAGQHNEMLYISGLESTDRLAIDTTTYEDGELTVTFTVADINGLSTTATCTYMVDNVPEAPSYLESESVEEGIFLRWYPSDSENVTSYIIERSTAASDGYVQVVQVGTASTMYTDAGSELVLGTVYYYRVKAVSAVGVESEYSGVSVCKYTDVVVPEVVAMSVSPEVCGGSQTAEITVSAEDNVAVTYMVLSCRAPGKTTYHIFETLSGDAVSYKWDVSGLESGTYSVMATAYDAAGNHSVGKTVSVVVDNDGPVVSGLEVWKEEAGVIFVWSCDDFDDLASFSVYRGQETDNEIAYTLLAETGETAVVDETVTSDGVYYYYVVAKDLLGNEYTTEPVFVIVDTTAPEILSVVPADGAVIYGTVSFMVDVKDNCQLASVEMTTSGGDAAGTMVGGIEASATFEVLTSDLPEGELTVTFTVEDLLGNTAEKTYSYTVDNVPDAPEGLTAVADAAGITLNWNAPGNPNVGKYIVERSEGDASDFARLAQVDANMTTYRDKDVVAGTTYYYRVLAQSTGGVQGAYSKEASCLFSDIVAPTVRLSVSPEICGGTLKATIKVTAFDNVGIDKIVLTYSVDGEIFSEIAALEDSGEYVWDVSQLPSGACAVKAVAYDAVGNVSQGATATVTVDNTVPAKIVGVAAIGDVLDIKVTWAIAAEANTTGYRLYRRVAGEIDFQLAAQINGRNTLSWTDAQAEEEVTYEYYVVGVNYIDQDGEASDIVSAVRMPDEEAPVVTKITPDNGSFVSGTKDFSVAAQDNVGVTALYMYFSHDGGETWNLAWESDSDYAVLGFNTASMKDGIFKVKGVAWDAAGNQSAEVVHTYFVDNTGPAAPGEFSHESTTVTVTLRWTESVDEDVEFYRVERLDADGTWTKVTDVYTTLGANITGLMPGGEYTYRVVGYDQQGNRGVATEELTVTTLQDTNVPVITLLRPTSGWYNESIDLTVTASDDYSISSITVQTSADGTLWTDVHTQTYTDLATRRTLNWTLKLADYEEGALYVRALAKDPADNVSDSSESAPFVQHVVDRTAPGVPEGVSAAGHLGYVEVAWTAGDESGLSYSVCRAAAGSEDFVLRKSGLTTINYIDYDVEQGASYNYKVSVCDAAGNCSEESEVVTAEVPKDVTAPEIAVTPGNGTTLSTVYRTVRVTVTDDLAVYKMAVKYSTDGVEYTVLSQVSDIDSKSRTEAVHVPLEALSADKIYIQVIATDEAGNEAQPVLRQYTADKTAPVVVSAGASYADNGVSVTWVGAAEEDLVGYKVYRSRNGGSSYSLIAQRQAVEGQTVYSCKDYNLALTQTTYVYKVEAVDTLGNTSTLTTSAVTVPDRSAPQPVLACEATMEVGVEYIIDASRSTDDSKVAAWHFDFGDGAQSDESTPVHTYTQTGEYTLTLTVTDDAGNTATLIKNITVRERTLLGTVEITVVDQDGAVVPNAPVHFDLGSEDQVIRVTNSAGKVTFTGQVGRHKVGCIIPDNNWLTTITDVVVTAGETTSMTMTMVRETMIEGEFEIHQMTRTEIIAAGINPDAPENQYIVQVNVSLTYGTEKVESTFTYNPGTGTSTAKPIRIVDSDDGTERQLVPVVILPEEAASEPGYEFSREASVAYLDIPIGMTALKDFFEVKLHIINNDSEDSAMVDNVVQLNVPGGLTLMDTYVSQASPTVTIAEIRGQSTHTVKWILRGDKVGEYYLTADFTGTLDEFGWTISTQFVADEPLVVTGLSDLLMTVEIPEELDNGTLYYNVSLTNLGSMDINDPTLETGHDLIETVLYNDAGIATSIVGDLETLPGGYCLTKHYMEVDQTNYSDINFELQNFAYSVGETYGMQVLILKKPVSYFKAALSPLENASDKADLTYTTNQSVYDYIMNHNNFVYWSMYKSTGAVAGELTSNAEEALWDGLKLLAGNGGLKDLFGGEDEEFIRAIILDAMELSVEGNEDAATYVMFCEFLDKAMDVMEDMNLDEVFGDLAESYGACMKETFKIIALEYKWEFYTEGYKGVWGRTDDFVLERCKVTWSDHYIRYGAYKETTMSKFLHQLFSADGFEAVWEGIGFTADSIQAIQTAAESVQQDIGIYLAAQSTLDQCNLFLDALIAYSTGVGDPQRVQSAAEEVKEAMNGLDVIGEMAREIAKEEFWVGADMAKDKLLDKLNAKAPKIALKVKIILKFTTYVGDNLFNVTERHNIADNIRFVSIMSDSIWYQIQVYHELYKGYPDDIYAQPYMQLLAYLINLRAIGESQVAHFGVSYEVLEGVFDSEDLLVAVRNMSDDTKGAESWIEWRDIVEDKISRARIQLLKNPLAVDVNERSAPVVTFDYARGQTAQSFSSDYEYSIDRGVTWTTCVGGPIQLERQAYTYQLWVRGVAGGNAPEKRTADIWISSPSSLDDSVQVMQTPGGYRITGLDSYKQYMVTFSNEDRYMDYDEQLDITIPAGSSSYEYATGAQYAYAHIRSLATGTVYASYIACRETVNMPSVKVTKTGGGTVTGAGSYEYGSQVTLTATPAIAFDFAGWYEGDTLLSSDSVLTLTADSERTLTALFIQREPPVEVSLDSVTGNTEQVKLVFRESLDYAVWSLLVGYTAEGKMVRQGLFEFTSPDVGTEQLVDVTGWTDCAFITAFLVDENYAPLMDSVDVR